MRGAGEPLTTVNAAAALSVPRRGWFEFLSLILAGKAIWEFERHLWRHAACPRSAADPRYWCHALWHLLSALAHRAAMVYHGDLWLAWDRRRRKRRA